MARILITGDEPLIRNLVRATLDFGEHELMEAPDGAAALALAKAAPPELVILDLGLPGDMSGREVLGRLRISNPRAHLIVLGASARDAKSARAAATDFLTKPVSPLQLIERIESALAAAVS